MEIEYCKHSGVFRVWENEERCIAECPDKKAAHLIAAAPDMLAALKKLVDMANPYTLSAKRLIVLQEARDAIKKVEGE